MKKKVILISLILACMVVFTFSLNVMAADCDHAFNITDDFGDSYFMECEKCGVQERFYTYDSVIDILKNYREDLKLENGLTISFTADSVFSSTYEISDVYISDPITWDNYLELKYSEFISQSDITDFTGYMSQEVAEVTYPAVSSSIEQFLSFKKLEQGDLYTAGYNKGYIDGVKQGVTDYLVSEEYKLALDNFYQLGTNEAINQYKESDEYISVISSAREDGKKSYISSSEYLLSLNDKYNEGYIVGYDEGYEVADSEHNNSDDINLKDKLAKPISIISVCVIVLVCTFAIISVRRKRK